MSDTGANQGSPSPEETASVVSRLFFLWIGSLIKKARRQTLTERDVWDINIRDRCCTVHPAFDKLWTTGRFPTQTSSSHLNLHEEGRTHAIPSTSSSEVRENIRQRKGTAVKQSDDVVTHSLQDKVKTEDSASFGTVQKSENQNTKQFSQDPKKGTGNASLLMVTLKAFWPEVTLTLLLKLVHSVCAWIASPFLLGLLIESTADPDASIWVGVSLTITMVTVLIFGRMIDEQGSYLRQAHRTHIETVLKTTIFRKALNLHTSSRNKYSIGQMTNLMSSDVGNISSRISNISFLFYSPLNIMVIFCQLYFILGPAAGLGLLVIAILMPINMHISDRINELFAENIENKDEKMKLLNEVLTGMKVLKLQAWETCFEDMLRDVRHKEVEILKQMTYYRALHIFSWNTAPYIISVAIFTGYFYLNHDSILTVRAVFAVIAALNMLRLSINQAPDLINDVNKIRISSKRVERFLYEKEFMPINAGDSKGDVCIEMKNASFTWDPTSSQVLTDINLSIQRSCVIAVVGQVGAGKSSLISAILGEIEKTSGHIDVQGTTAYVSQQAWIQNDTLQNNILFGNPIDITLYKKVIEACALQPDIDLLPAGDRTEIGERGINLSGGQKQRVSLARAVYNDADIYLLDDPLSAVDSHVGKHIFDNVIKGILRNKVCVLVTHNLRYLPQVDNVLVIDNGTVAERGSFRELLNSDGAFTKVLKTYLADYQENKECLEDLESEENMYLDVDLKTKLKRLESEELTQDQAYKRQKSSEMTTGTSRQLSRHLSTSDDEKSSNGKCIEEEKFVNIDSKTSWQLFPRYIQAYGIQNMALLLVFYVLYYVTFIRANLLLAQWADDDVLKNVNDSNNTHVDRDIVWRTNLFYLGGYTFLGICLCVFILLYAYMMSRGVVRASQHLHDKMLNSILKSPMVFFDTTPVGRITNRFSHDMKVIDDLMPSCLEFWLDCVFNVTIGIAVVLYTTPEILVLFIPLFYYYMYLRHYFLPARSQMNELQNKTLSPVESYFTESIMGSEVIRAFRNQHRVTLKMESAIDQFHKMRLYGHAVYRWLGVNMLGLGHIIFGATTLLKGLSKGTSSAAAIGFGSSFSWELNGDMRWLVLLQSDLETNLTSVGRIEQYINSPNEADWRRQIPSLTPRWPDKGKIVFRNYSLRYRQGLDLVLRNISFTVNGSEKIGVVGRTGAGKSSLMLSLFRLVEPAEGAIFIDGIDIADIGLHDLREKISIIPQDPVLFTGTLRMNLDPQGLYTDEDIWTALDHTHLRQFVESLPDRLQSECGEGGNNFSVGQRQLFCMARTLLRKAKILVLDEATAAVDMETDDLIQQTIRSEFKDCTVLTIAHRLNTVMDYDRILTLNNGCVEEFDTPTCLLQQTDSAFYNMAKAAGLV